MKKQQIIEEMKEIIPRAERLCEEKNNDKRYDTAFKYGAVCQAIKNLIEKAENN